MLRLLELPAAVQAMVADNRLSMGHARALITAANAEALAEEVMRRDLSVRDTEKLARAGKAAPKSTSAAKPSGPVDADVALLERQIGDILGLKVEIEHGEKGGRITVGYTTLDQLDLVCKRLSGELI